jgi:predicted ATPase
LDEAFAMLTKNDERLWETELYRIKGELLLAFPTAPPAEAEIWFRRAIQTARQQQARAWELRATLRLGRLLQRQGQQEEARQMLAAIYGRFTEGFATADLQDARALLEELG